MHYADQLHGHNLIVSVMTFIRYYQSMERRFLTIVEAAALLGVSEATIRRKIARGELVAHRLGPKSTRIDEDDLERFLRASRS